jgi:hypothetical protein
LKKKYKAQSSEKGRQLEAEINRSNKMHQIFKHKHKLMDKRAQKRGAECKKENKN